MRIGPEWHPRRGRRLACIEACEPRRLLSAVTYNVTNSSDSDPGSLRAAIIAANNNVNVPGEADTIRINITGPNHTVEVLSPLPVITGSVYLGRDINEDAPSTPLIELDGSNPNAGANGLVLQASDSLVTGVAINRFQGNGLTITGSGNTITSAVYIGTNIAGTAALGNGGKGIAIAGNDNTISLVKVVHNGNDGIEVSSGTGNDISLGDGVNEIRSNGALAIDIGPDGLTPNDANDGDGGSNNSQNTPVLNSVSFANGEVTVSVSINTTPNTEVLLDFFANPVATREGWQSLTQRVGNSRQTPTMTTDASGNASNTFTLVPSPLNGVFTGSVSPSSYITATATAVNELQVSPFVRLNTSEFAAPIASALPAWLAPASVATWNAGTHTLTVNGPSTIIADPGADQPIINNSGGDADDQPCGRPASPSRRLEPLQRATATLTTAGNRA